MKLFLLVILVLGSYRAAGAPLDDAKSLAAQGKHAEAIARFDAAIAADGKLAEGHAGKALSLLALGRNDEAAEAVGRALALRPDEIGFAMIAGRVDLAKGDVAGARKRYDEVAKRSPNKAGVIYADLAAALSARKDAKLNGEIDAALKAAAEARPPHLEALFHLGQSHVGAGREEGRVYLTRYLEESQKLPEGQRDGRRIQLAKQMIRALDIARGGRP